MRCDMRAITILLAALALASCDDDNGHKNHRALVSFDPLLAPSATVAARISPSPLPIVTIPTIGCPVGLFTTAFDIVIAPTGRSLFVDHVTFRLLDGTNIGGPTVTIPSFELNSMFGSTEVSGSRAFAFNPRFGCGVRRPISIVGDIGLVDRSGSASSVTVSATF